MATQTQLQLEPLSGCVHEQMLQAEYTRQHWRIHALCAWMLDNPAEARRVELQVFLDVWRGADRVHAADTAAKHDRVERDEERDEERLGAAFAAHFRSLFATRTPSGQPERPGQPGQSRQPAQPGQKVASHLREAVRQLPAPQRLLYLLHELEGYSPAQLGDWLDLDPSYCSRLIHRARVRLLDAVSN